MTVRTSAHVVLALALAAGLAGCTGDAAEDTGMTGDTMAMDTLGAVQPQPAGALTEGQIVQVVMTVNTADSANGAMAQSMATDTAVKAFGRRMEQDHGTANQQLRQLTQSGGVTAEPSDLGRQLEQEAQQAGARLHSLSGAEYDRAYIAHEVQMHQRALDLLDQQLGNVQSAQLRQQLESIRTAVQSHHQQAQQIQAQLGQGATTTTGQ